MENVTVVCVWVVEMVWLYVVVVRPEIVVTKNWV